MSDAVVKFDPNKLMEMVRDKIRATYVDMIPDEQWHTLVQKEVDAFFVVTSSQDCRGDQSKWSSKFQQVVWEVLTERAKEEVKNHLSSLKGHGGDYVFGQYKPALNAQIQEMIVNNAGSIMMDIMAQSVQNMLNNMQVR